jgi:hypothetical protein
MNSYKYFLAIDKQINLHFNQLSINKTTWKYIMGNLKKPQSENAKFDIITPAAKQTGFICYI